MPLLFAGAEKEEGSVMTVSVSAVGLSTADTCVHVGISSAHADSSMDTDTVMKEASSCSAFANNRGNSAPQQHADKQQQSIRPQVGSGNAQQPSTTRFDLQPAAWQDCMSTVHEYHVHMSSISICILICSKTCASAGRTPLHYAALHGRAAAVEELIKQGAAHGAKDNRGGYTPLHLAADAGQCEVISRLFELGADLEAVSTKGWTPLALANMKVNDGGIQFILLSVHFLHDWCSEHPLWCTDP